MEFLHRLPLLMGLSLEVKDIYGARGFGFKLRLVARGSES